MSTFLASEAVKPELVRLAYSLSWATSLGKVPERNGWSCESVLYQEAGPCDLSGFNSDPHGPAGLGEVRGEGQAPGGRRLALPLSGSAAPALRFDAATSSL